jgi:hypothetical protein
MCTTMEAFDNGRESSMRDAPSVRPYGHRQRGGGIMFCAEPHVDRPTMWAVLDPIAQQNCAGCPSRRYGSELQINLASVVGPAPGPGALVRHTQQPRASHQRHHVHGLAHEVQAKPARTRAAAADGMSTRASGGWARPQEARSASSARSARPGRTVSRVPP